MVLWLALGIGFFFALNIGASGTAAAMSAAYGAGAVHRQRALRLVAAGALAGSIIAGRNVTITIGKGVLPDAALPVACAVIILAAAGCTLFLANLAAIPLSTSEVTVGSVVGTAILLGSPAYWKLALIVSSWITVPALSFLFAYLLQRGLSRRLRPYLRSRRPLVALLLTVGGSYEAFAAGANNVANAVGPLIGAGLIGMDRGILLGGIGLALGALGLGGRVLNTNAKKITALDLLSGSIVSFTGATLVLAASLLGVPTPLTQVTTMGIVGVGCANGGTAAVNAVTMRRVAAVWLVSPVISMAISYAGTVLLLPVRSPPAGMTAAVIGSTIVALVMGHLLLRPGERRPATAEPGVAAPEAEPQREAVGDLPLHDRGRS